jgi:hypothetical protein
MNPDFEIVGNIFWKSISFLFGRIFIALEDTVEGGIVRHSVSAEIAGTAYGIDEFASSIKVFIESRDF